MSLADTAAQKGVVGLWSFRQPEAKPRKLGLKPVVTDHAATAAGVGGKARGLAKVSVPTGIAGVGG
eukprot:14534267-Alexandrium_andersonii.AAC.1